MRGVRRKFIDETDKVYGRWTVLGFAGLTRFNAAQWTVQCLCGQIKIVRGDGLRTGRSRSCTCLQKELATERLASVGNYRESASDRTTRMWASGIRPKIRQWPGKVLAGENHPNFKHGRRMRGTDRNAYNAWRKQQAGVVGAGVSQ
jgi:hypothetical protein